jgi:hypothetical protein
MIIKRTWVSNKRWRKGIGYTKRYICEGWFLFGLIPLYIVRMNA